MSSRCFDRLAPDEVETSIPVEISHRHAPGVFDVVHPGWPGNIHKLPLTHVGEKAIVFVAVPRVGANKFTAKEITLLETIDVCDRTPNERQSKIGVRCITDPAIGGINIAVGVVIDIHKRHAPPPASTARIAIFDLGKGPITVVAE